MAKIGYIYKADIRGGYEDSEKWMNEYGCCRIASDDSEDLYATRPAWRAQHRHVLPADSARKTTTSS